MQSMWVPFADININGHGLEKMCIIITNCKRLQVGPCRKCIVPSDNLQPVIHILVGTLYWDFFRLWKNQEVRSTYATLGAYDE